MADNQFANRPGESSAVDERELIIRALKDEFPDDPLIKQGILSPEQTPPVVPVTDLAQRNPNTGLLEVDADVSAIYAEYTLSKLQPGLDNEQLDDVLDDEFNTFVVSADGIGLPKPVVTGLFYITTNTPGDYHDMYIQFGVHRIPEMIAAGMEPDQIQRSLFCVWYIERNKARPISTYKTLEVMLVERNLTYESIAVATANDVQEYDLNLDGRFTEYESVGPNGELLSPPTFVDELDARKVLPRDNEWNMKIRYIAGYRPGRQYIAGSLAVLGADFIRDPAEYVRPKETRNQQEVEQVVDENGIEYSRDIFPREARQRAEYAKLFLEDPSLKNVYDIEDFTGPITPETLPQLFSLLEEDPMDLYFDGAYRVSRMEQMRADLEGKLVIPQWSKEATTSAFAAMVSSGTDELRSDDLFLGLSFFMFGHFKQVQDINVLKRIATDMNVDISDYDSGLETFIPGTEILDGPQFDALSEIFGIINIMYKRGAIKLLGGPTDEYWTTFPKIANIDQLDIVEYEKYQIEYKNMYDAVHLIPYEPKGSLVYYQQTQLSKNYLSNLQKQAVLQGELDKVRRQMFEKLLPTQTAIDDMEKQMDALGSTNFITKLQNLFGPESDVQNIIKDHSNTMGDINAWVLYKKKKKGDKEKGRKESIFTLFQTEWQIKQDSFNDDQENYIFYRDGVPSWHINGHFGQGDEGDSDWAANRLAAAYGPTGSAKLKLLTPEMEDAFKSAGGRGHFEGGVNMHTRDMLFKKPAKQSDAGNRLDRLWKNDNYFRATVAKFIYMKIIEPGQTSNGKHDYTKLGFPSDFPYGVNKAIGFVSTDEADVGPQNIVSTAENLDIFLTELRGTLRDVKLELLEFDELLMNCTKPEELLELNDKMDAVISLNEKLKIDIFTTIKTFNDYIDREHLALMKSICRAISYIRTRVKDQNDKYYISWPGLSQARVSKWISGDSGFTVDFSN